MAVGEEGRNSDFLLTDRVYQDFSLRFEVKLGASADSGGGLRALPGERLNGPPRNLEVQIIDDERLPADAAFPTGFLFWSQGRTPVKPAKPAPLKPSGEWNLMEVQLRGQSLRVAVNGQIVRTENLNEYAGIGTARLGVSRSAGRIGFQRFAGEVRFRNIHVKEVISEPFLALESGGHNGSIGSVMFTPDGRELISSSEDGTIRFWSVSTGEALRVLRPILIPGGRAGGGALSPDGQILAILRTGMIPSDQWIYLITLPAGTVSRVIPAEHPWWIRALVFSPTGESFATSGDDATARLWNVRTGVCDRIFRGHKGSIRGLAFSPDGKYLATSSGDETARVWSIETGETRTTLSDKERRTFNLARIAFAPDGQAIATGSWGSPVRIWGLDGKIRQRLNFDGGGSLIFTRSPNEILVNDEHRPAKIDLTSGEVKSRFLSNSHRVWSSAISPDGRLAATGGSGGDNLYLWNLDTGSAVHKLAGKGGPIWGVGWSSDGNRIAWGHSGGDVTWGKVHPLERTFDLRGLFLEGRPEESFERFRKQQGDLSLQLDYGSGDVTVVENGADGSKIPGLRQGGTGAYTFISENLIVLSDSVDLGVYSTRTGKRTLKFKMSSTARELSVSPNNRFLLSGSSDGIVRIWSFGRPDPLLSIFFAGDDWVAWTTEGYYAASPGGEQLMGWQVNNGPYAMGTFYPASQFRKTLYRPDVIKRLLDAGSLEKALAEADAAAGQRSRRTEVAQVLPPKVSITSPATSKVQINGKMLKVDAVARSVGASPVTEMRLLLDGRPLPNAIKTIASSALGEAHATWTVDIPPGSHRLTVQASSAVSKGVSEPLEIVNDGEAKRSSSLYVLAIGINDYPDKRLKLDCATPDARSLQEAFRTNSRRLFKDVEVKLLLDGQATKVNILDGLHWLATKAKPGDVAIVFYAGHGDCKIEGEFYLVPVDANLRNLSKTGISGEMLKRGLAELPSTTMLVLDACYAGSFDGKKRKTRALPERSDSLIRDLTYDAGLVVMCGAWKEQEAAEENGKGFFTQALVEGLSGKADLDKDGVVEVDELHVYVRRRVLKLSDEDQEPTISIPSTVRSFPLSKPGTNERVYK